MDAQITQFLMDVDGQTVRYAHGPQVATNVQWPGPRGTNQARIELTPQAGPAGLSASGPWALNRLLDKAQLRRDRKSTRLNSSHSCASRMPPTSCTKNKNNKTT